MASLESPEETPLILFTTHRQRLKAYLALLSVSLIWGIAFVVQRIAAAEIGAFLFNGLRFLIGAVVLFLFASWGKISSIDFSFNKGIHRNDLPKILLAGMLLFNGAAFQQIGLKYTTAGNAGFVTRLYVVWIPFIMAFAWRQLPRFVIWIAAFLAAMGLYLLSTGGQMRWNTGDILVLMSSVFWTLHLIFISRFVPHLGVVRLAIGQYLVCGVVSIVIGLTNELHTLSALIQDWWVVVFTGVISVGLGYTLQAIGQRQAPPLDAAILLSMEAVFAALFGWWIMDEKLALLQLVGCGVIFMGMLLAQSEKLTNSAYTEDKIPL
jgi:drug/metabolite transporter (DMT)-like permease